MTRVLSSSGLLDLRSKYATSTALLVANRRSPLDSGRDGEYGNAQLAPREPSDLLTDDGVGIEIKVARSWTAVTRQLLRYARHDQVRALAVTTRASHHQQVPAESAGSLVAVHSLIGQGL